jgi:hypothetical protein
MIGSRLPDALNVTYSTRPPVVPGLARIPFLITTKKRTSDHKRSREEKDSEAVGMNSDSIAHQDCA